MQVLMTAVVVAFMAAGCGNRGFNPPSDEEMMRNFLAHEDAFTEIAAILPKCPYGSVYPPFHPIERAEDSLCLASLGAEQCARLDSLLAAIGCERAYFKSRHALWQIEQGDFSSIPSIEELPDTLAPAVSILYYAAGWSISPSVYKQYVYNPESVPTDTTGRELNEWIGIVRDDPDTPGGMASRHIKGDWYIELCYDK